MDTLLPDLRLCYEFPTGFMCCSWCQKVGSAKQFNLKTPNGNKAFCSEQCFTHSRRANFKRNKTCDWCRHVRHTVNYVDFQDGEHQLQFCSDKCLNQYKMNIFCKETQAHLESHPHLQEASTSDENETSGTDNLITPDLWMRDCRSHSPDTDKSGTPPRIPSPLIEIKMSHLKPRHLPHKSGFSDNGNNRTCKRSPKRSVGVVTDPAHSPSGSEPYPASCSPSNTGNIRNPNFHPTGLMPEQPRALYFPPVIHPIGLPGSEVGASHQRHPLRKIIHPQGLPPPPLLPLGRSVHPPPMFPALFHSIIPPPTTLIPYPILLPIPLPIPIPIPIPGIKFKEPVSKTETESQLGKSQEDISQNQQNEQIKKDFTNVNIFLRNTDKSNIDEEQSPTLKNHTVTNQQQSHAKLIVTPPRKRKRIINEQNQNNGTPKKTKSVHPLISNEEPSSLQ